MGNAYFSLATDEFVPGVVCLVKSLRRLTNTPIRILDLDLSSVNRWLIEEQGATCIQVKRITSAKAKQQPWHWTKDFANVCYNKLHLWATDYDKVIYLDADMVVLKDMDHLFDLPCDFAAVPTFEIRHDQKTREVVGGDWTDRYFNAGFLVVTPNKKTFTDMMWLKDFVRSPTVPEDTTDQSFLNEYYRGRWHKLDRKYNAYRRVYSQFRDKWSEMANDIHAIHYTVEKPWHKRLDQCDEIEKLWWDYYMSKPVTRA
jgi:lipopolysaccharide biosynthesis glycosyltransferase